MPVPDSKPSSTKSVHPHQKLENLRGHRDGSNGHVIPIPVPDLKRTPRASADQELKILSNHPNGSSGIADNPSEKKKSHWAQISPALYATPEVTPLPDTALLDSPSSFPPSPYVVNHKRRGPPLPKSSSQGNVPLHPPEKVSAEEKLGRIEKEGEKKVLASATSLPAFSIPSLIKEETDVNGLHNEEIESCSVGNGAAGADDLVKGKNVHVYREEEIGSSSCASNGAAGADDLVKEKHLHGLNEEIVSCCVGNGDLKDEEIRSSCVRSGGDGSDDAMKLVGERMEVQSESSDFLDPKDTLSYASSTDGEIGGGVERPLNTNTPMMEFFDAWEDLSSEGGGHTSGRDFEAEIREMRLNLLTEIEKRKQAEESLNKMKNQWVTIVQHFSDVGLSIPSDPSILGEDGQSPADLAEELCQQVHLSRVASESVGRETAKAEAEMALKAQIESKNFEIGRLLDRIHYHEAVNREMSQRNQENIEKARRKRQMRRRRQRWYWGFVAATITIGTGVLIWTYIPSGNKSTSGSPSLGQEENEAAD